MCKISNKFRLNAIADNIEKYSAFFTDCIYARRNILTFFACERLISAIAVCKRFLLIFALFFYIPSLPHLMKYKYGIFDNNFLTHLSDLLKNTTCKITSGLISGRSYGDQTVDTPTPWRFNLELYIYYNNKSLRIQDGVGA